MIKISFSFRKNQCKINIFPHCYHIQYTVYTIQYSIWVLGNWVISHYVKLLKGQCHKNVNCEKICSCFWPKQFTSNWFLHCCPILRHSSIILWGRNLFLSPERIRHDLPYFFKLALCRTRDFPGYRQFFVNTVNRKPKLVYSIFHSPIRCYLSSLSSQTLSFYL